MASKRSLIHLGIDTGGTYTDSVLWSDGSLITSAKSLTTRKDLSVGIANSVNNVLVKSGVSVNDIGLVAMSTTLATNSLIEGVDAYIVLVLIGFNSAFIEQLKHTLDMSGIYIILCEGGHDAEGNAYTLDISQLENFLRSSDKVYGFAVCGRFAVRNAEHENKVSKLIHEHTGLTVSVSHKLSHHLDGIARAITTIQNARLIGIINRLIDSTYHYLHDTGITAPLMIVKGDGSLTSSDFARQYPIETVLSGPAASISGVRYITGYDDAIVVDIGGTTTDIAILDKGKPVFNDGVADTINVKMMTNTVSVTSVGLGGDSEVRHDFHNSLGNVIIGPRRVIPLSLIAVEYPDIICSAMAGQAGDTFTPGRYDGMFVVRSAVDDWDPDFLSDTEKRMYSYIGDTPVALDMLLGNRGMYRVTLERLWKYGLVQFAGFTPSDASHVLGYHDIWNVEAARIGALLLSRRRNRLGDVLATTSESASRLVLSTLTRKCADAIMQVVLEYDGIRNPDSVTSLLLRKAMTRDRNCTAHFSVSVDRPVIAVGASASIHLPGVSEYLGNKCVVPDNADVAAAIGAVVGVVSVTDIRYINVVEVGRYRVTTHNGYKDFTGDHGEKDAIVFACDIAVEYATRKARDAGACDIEIKTDTKIMKSTLAEGQDMFIEAYVFAFATGRPGLKFV